MIGKSSYLSALKDGLPNIVTDDDVAEDIVDVIFSVPVQALEKGYTVLLPNLGTISINKNKGQDCLTYHPDNALIKCVLQG